MAKIDWKCIRYAQKELCIKKAIGLDKFKEIWVKTFGEPTSDSDRKFLQTGIKDFYEDYLTSDAPDVASYLKSTVSEEHIK